MRILITRHGKTVANKFARIQGHADSMLTAQGVEQAARLAHVLENEEFDAIYTSDVGRAKKTAQWIADRHPDTLFIETELLREYNFGSLAGTPSVDIDWDNPPEEFESRESVQQRVAQLMDEIMNEGHENVLFVSHGGTIDALFREAMRRGAAISEEEIRTYRAPNGKVHELVIDGNSVTLTREIF